MIILKHISESNICNQNAATWTDSNNFNCESYTEAGWCTSAGYGSQWNINQGLFRTVSANNYSALNCPDCGCQGDSEKL